MRTLDHVVFNTRDHTDAVVALFTRLGFSVGARGYHTLGSINHTIVFGTDYLELLGYPPGAPPAKRPELVTRPEGLMATVLGTVDADATRAELLAASLAPRPVQAFSRPVDLPDGGRGEAAFRVTRLEPDAVPGTWFYYCQQQTPDMVWRPEWQVHANGATGIAEIGIEVPDLAAALPLYAACAGSAAVREAGDQAHLQVGDCCLRLREAAGAGRMTGLIFACTNLAQAAAVLASHGVAHSESAGRIAVAPSETHGATLQFAVPAR